MQSPIPILDLTAQYAAIKAEVDRAVLGVLASGQYINGPNVSALEEEVARYVGTSYAVGLNSGTDALHLALRALDIGPGDEVITVPFTFVATTEAIGLVGATPVFVDIDPRTYNIDPSRIEAAITPRTRVILPVHLYGAPAPLAAIMEIARRHGLAVIEDCAQAIGAEIDGKRVGSSGTFGCFSFFPSKNLGAFGDGGMVTCNDSALTARVRQLAAHGGSTRYHHEELGVNSRLDEMQAAILRVKLPHLPEWIAARRSRASAYNEAFAGNEAITTPGEDAGCLNVYHQYTLRVRDRDRLQRELGDDGIRTMVYYPIPLHLQSVHKHLGYRLGDFPAAEAAAGNVLSLPIYPELPRTDQQRVIAAVLEFTSPALV